MSTTKKISRKLRMQNKKHLGKGVSKKPTRNKGFKKELVVQTPPLIKRLALPDHTKLLEAIVKTTSLKSGQILQLTIPNLEIRWAKKKKERYVYFDRVSTIAIEKHIYGGRRKGLTPKQVVIHEEVSLPHIPGYYVLQGAIVECNGKNGNLILSQNAQTEWIRITA